MSKNFNPARRYAVKAVAGVSVAGLTASSSSAMAGLLVPATDQTTDKATGQTTDQTGEIIECKLLCRDDSSRVCLLMHNKTDADIVANRFLAQTIRFDDLTLNMATAFIKPATVKAQDRILVLLNHKSDRLSHNTKDIIHLTTDTKYPTVGTRAVEIPVRICRGVGIIGHGATVSHA